VKGGWSQWLLWEHARGSLAYDLLCLLLLAFLFLMPAGLLSDPLVPRR